MERSTRQGSSGGDRWQRSLRSVVPGPRFIVVVPLDRPDVYQQLTEALEGENVRVLLDRRRTERRERAVATPMERGALVDRRRTYRRSQSKLTMTAAHPSQFQAREAFTPP